MNIAVVPPSVLEVLKARLDRYPASIGGVRLRDKGIDLTNLNARGALAEARLRRKELNIFLSSRGPALEAFFTRLRLLLFDGETPIGSIGVLRVESEEFELEHVTLGGGEEIVEGLKTIEKFSESAHAEARLLQIPQIYLSSLILVQNGEQIAFLVLEPPYPNALAARTPSAFRQFIGELLEEHQEVFPPA